MSGWTMSGGYGETLSFGRKLLLVFALTVFLSVGAVTWIVSAITRRAFERANEAQTAALIAQFRREFSGGATRLHIAWRPSQAARLRRGWLWRRAAAPRTTEHS